LEYHQTHGARCAKAALREKSQVEGTAPSVPVGRIGGMRRSAIRINRLRKAAAFHYHVVQLLEGRAA
jgi:hypothetical protein